MNRVNTYVVRVRETVLVDYEVQAASLKQARMAIDATAARRVEVTAVERQVESIRLARLTKRAGPMNKED